MSKSTILVAYHLYYFPHVITYIYNNKQLSEYYKNKKI